MVAVKTLPEAHSLVMREINPLREVTPRLLAMALRRYYISSEQDIVDFLGQRIQLTLNSRRSGGGVGGSGGNDNSRRGSRGGSAGSNGGGVDHRRGSTGSDTTADLARYMELKANGTWDAVASLLEAPPYKTRRYELGDLRLALDLSRGTAWESAPVWWGILGTATRRHSIEWDSSRSSSSSSSNGGTSSSGGSSRCELRLSGDEMQRSQAPWLQPERPEQTMQVCE